MYRVPRSWTCLSRLKRRSTQLAAWKVIGEMVELERLDGVNWTIDTHDPEALQKKMGGTLFRAPGKK